MSNYATNDRMPPRAFRPAREGMLPSKLRRLLDRWKTLAAPAILAVAALGLSACLSADKLREMGQKTEEEPAPELLVKLWADKSVFQPGEAILLHLKVINSSNEPIRMRGLDDSSLTFWFGRSDQSRRVQRSPVVSKLEEKGMQQRSAPPVEVAPGTSQTRSFLLTHFAPEPGDYVCQIHFDPEWDSIDSITGKIYSNLVSYRVHGDRLFRRDSLGLVMMEEAINVAAADTPGDILLTDAILIEDEMGFYKWWVNLDFIDSSGIKAQIGYLIDPYQGRIWAEADPFPASMKSEQPLPIISVPTRR